MEKEKEFIKEIYQLKAAGYPAIFVQTQEESRLEEIIRKNFQTKVYTWDIINGLLEIENNGSVLEVNESLTNPVEAILESINLDTDSIFIIKDLQRFIDNVEIIRAFKTSVLSTKRKNITLIIPVPYINIPVEIEKESVIVNMPLPDKKQIYELANQILEDNMLQIQVSEDNVETGKGLTLNEAENAIALSIVKSGSVDKRILEDQKLQAVKKSGILEIYKPVPPENIGGLDNLKSYIKNRKKGFKDKRLPPPKGIILTGIPGTGKSLSAKAIASILEMPLIKMDFSSLKSSYVGESEKLLRKALKLIDAISPVVVWIDEIEKALGGVLSSNHTDGGTTSAMFGTLLTWMQESSTPKYIVATANDLNELLNLSQGALIRRFDDIFFVDLPDNNEKAEILKIMNEKYDTAIPLDVVEKMENWTGAEIEKFVISSIYDGIEKALKSIKPLYNQNKEVIEKVRKWARLNARLASSPVEKSNLKPGRKIKTN